jgi:hypothetical protein
MAQFGGTAAIQRKIRSTSRKMPDKKRSLQFFQQNFSFVDKGDQNVWTIWIVLTVSKRLLLKFLIPSTGNRYRAICISKNFGSPSVSGNLGILKSWQFWHQLSV